MKAVANESIIFTICYVIVCPIPSVFHEILSKSETNCLKQSPPNTTTDSPKNLYLFKPQLTCPMEREHNLLFGGDVFY